MFAMHSLERERAGGIDVISSQDSEYAIVEMSSPLRHSLIACSLCFLAQSNDFREVHTL